LPVDREDPGWTRPFPCWTAAAGRSTPSEPVDPTPALLDDRYELRSLLATGGMGQVWRAHDRVLDRPVAVKVLRSEFTDDVVFLTRFRSEARLSAGLTHPNVAVLHDYGETGPPGDRHVFLVMEMVEGEALSTLLVRSGPLDPDRALEVVRQTAAGLAAAHAAGVVHRDVKPGNLLVRPDGTVKITDFGIAWSATSVHVTRTGHVVGTAQYLSPEQAQGGPASPASDVYALGVVAFECLTGRRVFDGPDSVKVASAHIHEPPPPLPPGVPAPLRRLVERMLAKDPAARFRDGAALLAAIGGAFSEDDGRMATRVLPALDLGRAPDRTAPDGAAPDRTQEMPAVVLPPAAEAPEPDPEPPAPHRRRWAVPVAVALLAAAAVGTGVVLGTGGGAEPGAQPTPTPPPAVTSTAPPAPVPRVTTVRLAAAEHVGRPVAEVQAELTGLDLVVQLRPIQTSDVPAGQVIALDPAGEVPVGTTVTVTHAVAPPPPPPPPAPSAEPEQGDGDGDRDRGGDGERERDRDRGNGNGRGRGGD
jgi:eukaryotic-like serine/threonine-protein kinase